MNKIIKEFCESYIKYELASTKLDSELARINDIIGGFFDARFTFRNDRELCYLFTEHDNIEIFPGDLQYPIQYTEYARKYFMKGFPVEFFDMTDEEILAYLRREKDWYYRSSDSCEQTKRDASRDALNKAKMYLTDDEMKLLGL